MLHGLGGTTTRVVVVPSTGVERFSFEALNSLNAWQLCFVQNATGQYQKASGQLISSARGDLPHQALFVPGGINNISLKESVGVEIEGAS